MYTCIVSVDLALYRTHYLYRLGRLVTNIFCTYYVYTYTDSK